MLCILFYKVYLNILSFLILYQLENYKMIVTFQFLGFTCLNPRGQIKKMLYVDFVFRELLQGGLTPIDLSGQNYLKK